MARALLVVLVAAIGGVTAWFAFGHDAGTQPRPPAAPEQGREPAADEEAERLTAAARTAEESELDAGTETAEAARVPVEHAGPAVQVLVVRQGSEEPIADAEVGYVAFGRDAWALFAEADLDAMRAGDMEFFRRRNTVCTTDARGLCRVPVAKDRAKVVARHGDLFGETNVRPDQEQPHVLQLRRDHTLTVRVRDGSGRPAEGVEVMMQGSREDSRWGLGRTDADGTLVAHHTQAYAGDEATCPVEIHARGVGVKGESVATDLLRARRVQVDLALPPAGTMTFELITGDGEPFDLTGIHLPSLALALHEEMPSGNRARNPRQFQAQFDENGRATVHQVALGHYYAARVSSLTRRTLTGRGPTNGQPRLTVPVPVPDDLVVFRGRAVDSGGRPFAEQHVYLTTRYDRGMSSMTAPTTADGEFTVPMVHLTPGTDVRVSLKTQPRSREVAIQSGALEDPWPVVAGVNDLGQVMLGDPPLLLSGHLVVPEALASVQRIGWSCQSRQNGRWRDLHEVRTTWSADRRFEVRGEAPDGGELRLRFRKGAYLPMEPLEFDNGTEGVEITLRTAGRVDASFLVDDTRVASALSISLERTDLLSEPEPDERWMRTLDRFQRWSADKGRLRAQWTGLEAGRYRLELECPGAAELLALVPDIVVTSGPVEDPRLVDIDLRSRLRFVEIRVEGADGTPVTDAEALVLVADATGENWHGHKLQEGRAEVLIAGKADVRTLVPGFRSALVPDVTDDRVIRLEKPAEVRIRVVWPFPLPEGLTPQLQLIPSVPGTTRRTRIHYPGGGSGIENLTHSDAFIGTDGVAVVRPMFLGAQRLRIAMDPLGRGHYFYGLTPRTLDIDGGEPEEIVVQARGESLRETLNRMSK